MTERVLTRMAVPKDRPQRATRLALGEGPRQPIGLVLRTVTPVFGGGAVTRELDAATPVRPSAVRGHLRYWWRQLHLAKLRSGAMTPEALFAQEREIWGGAAESGKGGRSPVEIRVRITQAPQRDSNHEISFNAPEGYALFVARRQSDGTPGADRWKPEFKFTVSLQPKAELAPAYRAEINTAADLWMYFGGIGGRTRRGLGTLGFGQPALTIEQIRRLAQQIGARLVFGPPAANADAAWKAAVGWMREFRQGVGDDYYARRRGQGPRPGRSRWPEPDKIRHLIKGTWVHAPVYGKAPAWPRAQFGLPIVSRFQQGDPPGNFDLVWRQGAEKFERLASPVILKPICVAGKWRPVAILLQDRLPRTGDVYLRRGGQEVPGSAAPFSRTLGAGDQWQYLPLKETPEQWPSVLEIFERWLREVHADQKVQA